jgi:hypothetical protein
MGGLRMGTPDGKRPNTTNAVLPLAREVERTANIRTDMVRRFAPCV